MSHYLQDMHMSCTVHQFSVESNMLYHTLSDRYTYFWDSLLLHKQTAPHNLLAVQHIFKAKYNFLLSPTCSITRLVIGTHIFGTVSYCINKLLHITCLLFSTYLKLNKIFL